jgi:hypothetical protein
MRSDYFHTFYFKSRNLCARCVLLDCEHALLGNGNVRSSLPTLTKSVVVTTGQSLLSAGLISSTRLLTVFLF